MPRLTPITRRVFIKKLRQLGFDGPYVGGSHGFMRRADGVRLTIPNPHAGDISVSLQKLILRQAGIDARQWGQI